MSIGKGDAKKARYRQQTLGEAARSGLWIREFCRRRRLKKSQFYWRRYRLRTARPERAISKSGGREGTASFALVSEDTAGDAGIELVLDGGRRARYVPRRERVDENQLFLFAAEVLAQAGKTPPPLRKAMRAGRHRSPSLHVLSMAGEGYRNR